MVYEFFRDKIIKDIRLGSIGVKLGLETGLVDFLQQVRQFPMYGGFPTRDANGANPVVERLEPF